MEELYEGAKLDAVKGHLKRNWKKYAGAAALAGTAYAGYGEYKDIKGKIAQNASDVDDTAKATKFAIDKTRENAGTITNVDGKANKALKNNAQNASDIDDTAKATKFAIDKTRENAGTITNVDGKANKALKNNAQNAKNILAGAKATKAVDGKADKALTNNATNAKNILAGANYTKAVDGKADKALTNNAQNALASLVNKKKIDTKMDSLSTSAGKFADGAKQVYKDADVDGVIKDVKSAANSAGKAISSGATAVAKSLPTGKEVENFGKSLNKKATKVYRDARVDEKLDKAGKAISKGTSAAIHAADYKGESLTKGSTYSKAAEQAGVYAKSGFNALKGLVKQ